jgi:sodium-dependent phosphate transporter
VHQVFESQSSDPQLAIRGRLLLAPRPLTQLHPCRSPALPLSLAVIGGILGFSLAYGGSGAVNWAKPDTSGTAFPFQGAAPVVLSWFISPILTGCASALIFITLRFLVLNRPNAHKLSYFVLPPAVLLTVWVSGRGGRRLRWGVQHDVPCMVGLVSQGDTTLPYVCCTYAA